MDKLVSVCGGSLSGVRLGLLGLTFKAGTDDLRDSPAVAVARLLSEQGADLIAYDPSLRGDEPDLPSGVALVDTAYHAPKG
ncbi:UDP binding domain-containing protein [Saccharopolyspora hattusasensis]|uniref:UDP binding domain-containing protein n=1 Tax=Saccharopolyspora hattusasensis TaxID=1128679 RepID=UPI003D97C946